MFSKWDLRQVATLDYSHLKLGDFFRFFRPFLSRFLPLFIIEPINQIGEEALLGPQAVYGQL